VSLPLASSSLSLSPSATLPDASCEAIKVRRLVIHKPLAGQGLRVGKRTKQSADDNDDEDDMADSDNAYKACALLLNNCMTPAMSALLGSSGTKGTSGAEKPDRAGEGPESDFNADSEASLILQSFKSQQLDSKVIKTSAQQTYDHFCRHLRQFHGIQVRLYKGFGPKKTLIIDKSFDVLDDIRDALERHGRLCVLKGAKLVPLLSEAVVEPAVHGKHSILRKRKRTSFIAAGLIPPAVNLYLAK